MPLYKWMDRKYGNEPARSPDIEGHGRAWKLEWVVTRPNDEASLAAWLVDTEPFGHPIWPWYFVGVVHLRPVDGVGPAVLHHPEATHEFLVMALNPEHPLPDIDFWEAPAYLYPPDQIKQFTVRNDEQAELLCQFMVERICRGASPDQDFRSDWADCIDQTAEHICYGGHPSWN